MGKAAIIGLITVVIIALLALYYWETTRGSIPLTGSIKPSAQPGSTASSGGGAITIKGYEFSVNPSEVTETKTPIHLKIKLENRLAPVVIGGKLEVYVDGLPVAKIDIFRQLVDRGEAEVEATITLDNTMLDELWYKHLSQGEKSLVELKGYLEATKAGIKIPIDYKTRIETSIFPYTRDLDKTYDLGALGKLKIEKIEAQLLDISPATTKIRAQLYVKNELKTPLVVKGIVFQVKLPDGTIIASGTQEQKVTIGRGEEDQIPFQITLDNTKIPLLWYQHLKNNEKTTLIVEIWLRATIAGREVQLLRQHPVQVQVVIETDLFD